MNQKTKNLLFIVGAFLVVAATVAYFLQVVYAPYGMAIGSAAIAVVRLSSPYNGTNTRIKRLVKFQLFSSILLVASSCFMFRHSYEWLICLLVATVFETYAAFVMPEEK
ncbi:MAG: hypothetical protein PHH63_02770 [Bacteroidales bacterium]|jgi:hypothetical protein|nr:hypothetical protein [Bacteroidales bacterium]MDD3160837.1 hypothetical protein [Bacteroidales bacterium]